MWDRSTDRKPGLPDLASPHSFFQGKTYREVFMLNSQFLKKHGEL